MGLSALSLGEAMNAISPPAEGSESAAYTIYPLSMRARLLRAAIPLGTVLTLGVLFYFGFGLDAALAFAVLLALPAAFAAWKLYSETEVKQPTRAHGKLTPAAISALQRERTEEIAGEAWGSKMLDQSLSLLLWGVALLLLAIGAYLLYRGVAALPVSVALVLGASILAGSRR